MDEREKFISEELEEAGITPILYGSESTGKNNEVDNLSGLSNLELRMYMREILEKLDERQRKVLEARFFEKRKLKEVADEFGVSTTMIQDLEKRAILNIRKRIGILPKDLRK